MSEWSHEQTDKLHFGGKEECILCEQTTSIDELKYWKNNLYYCSFCFVT